MHYSHFPGFTPGKHCTDISHYLAGELAPLPSPRFSDFPFVCAACIDKTRARKKRSEAAFHGVETRRRAGGKRAPR